MVKNCSRLTQNHQQPECFGRLKFCTCLEVFADFSVHNVCSEGFGPNDEDIEGCPLNDKVHRSVPEACEGEAGDSSQHLPVRSTTRPAQREVDMSVTITQGAAQTNFVLHSCEEQLGDQSGNNFGARTSSRTRTVHDRTTCEEQANSSTTSEVCACTRSTMRNQFYLAEFFSKPPILGIFVGGHDTGWGTGRFDLVQTSHVGSEAVNHNVLDVEKGDDCANDTRKLPVAQQSAKRKTDLTSTFTLCRCGSAQHFPQKEHKHDRLVFQGEFCPSSSLLFLLTQTTI